VCIYNYIYTYNIKNHGQQVGCNTIRDMIVIYCGNVWRIVFNQFDKDSWVCLKMEDLIRFVAMLIYQSFMNHIKLWQFHDILIYNHLWSNKLTGNCHVNLWQVWLKVNIMFNLALVGKFTGLLTFLGKIDMLSWRRSQENISIHLNIG